MTTETRTWAGMAREADAVLAQLSSTYPMSGAQVRAQAWARKAKRLVTRRQRERAEVALASMRREMGGA